MHLQHPVHTPVAVIGFAVSHIWGLVHPHVPVASVHNCWGVLVAPAHFMQLVHAPEGIVKVVSFVVPVGHAFVHVPPASVHIWVGVFGVMHLQHPKHAPEAVMGFVVSHVCGLVHPHVPLASVHIWAGVFGVTHFLHPVHAPAGAVKAVSAVCGLVHAVQTPLASVHICSGVLAAATVKVNCKGSGLREEHLIVTLLVITPAKFDKSSLDNFRQ